MKRSLITRFCKDERGVVAVVTALIMVVIISFAALAIDVGKVFTDRRVAQGAADLAAMAAVTDLSHAEDGALATLHRNSRDPQANLSVELGIYTPDPAVPVDRRFVVASASQANAARVTVHTNSPLIFGKVISGLDSFAITTKAVATQSAFASFAIGTRLASLNGGVLNAVLGGLLGTTLNLSVMDYSALASARIDLFDYAQTFANRLSVTGGSYDSLLDTSGSTSAAASSLQQTVAASYGSSAAASRALAAIAGGLNASNGSVSLRALMDFGPYGTMSVGQKPKIAVYASVLDMLTAIAQVANGAHQVQTALNLGLPGIAAVNLSMTIGERPQGTSWITVGSKGAQVHTAQTRLLLTVSLLGGFGLPGVTLPIYVELASATAELSAINCAFPDATQSTLTLNVTPSVVDGWIGSVSAAQMTDFRNPPNPAPARIVDAVLVKVDARAHATLTNLQPTPVQFTYADTLAATKKTVGVHDATASLVNALIADTSLTVTVAGLNLGLSQVTSAAVGQLLRGAASPIDTVLDTALAALGVKVGEADVWATGLRCDGAVLVN
ncbi:MAG TPA: pilus assembly protein TadG-related protein [Xanthobacteraceae bacterium]|jgi:uncharacterized membrane protein|nr:pilus assembly protein TadG-related protein [Xanthobacteraceae bacterium]